MPDNIERKRLKKKMLDRWENEGGSIASEPVIPKQTKPASQRKRKDSQLPASDNSSRSDVSSSRKKRRAPNQK